ncbi:protein FAR1-RELATED SEQUENCE 5-like [Spinacia oleracea]|uniref:Protein FAR1-RELATED SEQUENCE 5-like n=1 Tax=Spinacia oleracea TaxID=3562 RepID=A0ABM3RQ27_SPIOL|nr:protein FAR1-RELATED SEQUENCE 5-like [Spinacia oleracea]
MDKKDGEVDRVQKMAIDLNNEYPSECDSYESSDTNLSVDLESDIIRHDTSEDDILIGDEDPNERNDISVDEPTPAPVEEPLVPPSVGMTFRSYNAVIEYYHEFGRQNGFEMKIRSRENVKGVVCDKSNDCTRLRLTCTKEGKFTPKGKDPSKPSRTQVTGCKAKITATFDKNIGEWKLNTVVLEHNHTLDPLNSRFMSNYRFINPHNKDIIMTNERAGVPISRNYATFAVRYGGYGFVPFSEKDCRNLVSKHRRLCLRKGDFAAMEKHFLEMSSKDKNFYYMYERGDDGRLKNVFWVDGRCRAAYRDFGDVISFDTVRRESSQSVNVTWMCSNFRRGYKELCLVVQDMARIQLCYVGYLTLMDQLSFWFLSTRPHITEHTSYMEGKRNAIKEVFPDAKHRWCIWHILRNAKKHLKDEENIDEIRKSLRRALHDSLHVEEFEKRWEEVVEKYKLHTIKWFDEMYTVRHRWVPVYFKSDFWAGMSSTQRSEKYVSEGVFQRLYTSKKFEEFQDQVRLVTYTSATKTQDWKNLCVRSGDKKAKWPKRQTFKVTLDRISYDVKCECKHFEFRGILCCRVVRVYHEEDVECVPEKYILSRWRKDLVRNYTTVPVPYYTPDKNPQAKRYIALSKEFEDIASVAIIDEKPYSFLMESLSKLRLEVKALVEGCQEIPKTVNTIGKVYGRHSSNGDEDERNPQHEDLVNQK